MPAFSKIANELFLEYKGWVLKNPNSVGNVESIFSMAALIVASKISDSLVTTQWACCSGKLLKFFHQLLIHSSRQKVLEANDKLKIFITLLDHCEFVIEKSVEHFWSPNAMWKVITYMQLTKCFAKLTLLLYYNDRMNYNLIVQPIKSPAAIANDKGVINGSNTELNDGFILASSGRVVRKMQAAPLLHDRHWKPPVVNIPNQVHMKYNFEIHQLVGELLYIVKPVITLGIIFKYGYGTWKPWLTSLAMDVISLSLLNESLVRPEYTPEERQELRKRALSLLGYWLRYPAFRLGPAQLLFIILFNVPFIGQRVKKQIDFYLRSYSALWSN